LTSHFYGLLDSAVVQDCTKFLLASNALLQLVRDIINRVCYQRYEQRLEKQEGRQMLMFALQKKIWKTRNYD